MGFSKKGPKRASTFRKGLAGEREAGLRREVYEYSVVVVVVVDFIILLGESQQALPFYWEP